MTTVNMNMASLPMVLHLLRLITSTTNSCLQHSTGMCASWIPSTVLNFRSKLGGSDSEFMRFKLQRSVAKVS